VVLSAYGDTRICRWDSRTGEPIGKPLYSANRYWSSPAFGVIDDAPVIIAGIGGTIGCWDVRTGKVCGKPIKGGIRLCSNDSRWAKSTVFRSSSEGDFNGTIRRWDALTAEAIGKPLRGHTSWINALAFGAIDGASAVVSASADETIRRWNARTGEAIGDPLEGHTSSSKHSQ
jgi:WD40 repeat protein